MSGPEKLSAKDRIAKNWDEVAQIVAAMAAILSFLWVLGWMFGQANNYFSNDPRAQEEKRAAAFAGRQCIIDGHEPTECVQGCGKIGVAIYGRETECINAVAQAMPLATRQPQNFRATP